MAISVKFYLKRPNSDKETAIYFSMNYGAYVLLPNGRKKYKPLKYYTTESILPEKWDSQKGEPLAPTARNKRINQTEYKELKARLEHIEAVAKDTYRRLENDGEEITNKRLTLELDKVFKEKKKIKVEINKDLLNFIEDYIEKSNKKIATKKQYKIVYNNISEYAYLSKKRPAFEDITLDFYLGFVDFLKHTKGYSPNTIGARIKGLKLFMNESYERGLHSNLDFRLKRFSKPSEETKAIYLNESELEKIYNFDFSNNKKLDRVRDIFLIGCYTGLRFSDLSLLSTNNIDEENNIINVKTQKTGKIVVIPIHTFIHQILQKYNNNLPKMLSNQKFNDYIKEVVKKVGIDEEIPIQKEKNTLSYVDKVPKYELITSHTARRSFATNAYLAGIPVISIMKITGHKTEAAFMKYIKISEMENAIQLQTNKFFNPMIINR